MMPSPPLKSCRFRWKTRIPELPRNPGNEAPRRLLPRQPRAISPGMDAVPAVLHFGGAKLFRGDPVASLTPGLKQGRTGAGWRPAEGNRSFT
jgi:hypothetical protein